MTIQDATTTYLFSGFRLDARHKRLCKAQGELVTLSARPFEVLLVLVQRNGTVVSREELMEAVWPRLVVEEHNLTQAISIVRKALEDTTSESQFIRTVPGRGYSFIAAVEEVALAAPAPVCGATPGWGLAKKLVPAPLRPAAALAVAVLVVVSIALFVSQTLSPSSDSTAPSARIASPLGISEVPRPESRIHNSIAVMPFVNLSRNGDEVFAVGLHDEIVSRLAQIDGLNVVARSSVVSLVEQGMSIAELTRVLRLESILSGTIRAQDGNVRINLQLVDVRTGVSLWSGSYDVAQWEADAMLALQGDIAANVGTALAAEIPRTSRKDFSTLPPEMADAYRYNIAAQQAHYRQDYADEWRLALKSIELDPDFYEGVHAFAAANLVLVVRPLPGMNSSEHAELALLHAERLIELAPERSEGHALRAVILAMDRNWAEAAAAIALLEETHAPLSSLEFAARVWMSLGDFEKAVAIYEGNLVSELVNPYGRGFLLAALELSGNRQQARRKYAVGQELHSQWWGDSVNVFLALGRGEAISNVNRLLGISDELKQLLGRLDDAEAVAAVLAAVGNNPVLRPLEARFYAALAATAGQHDLAVELLRRSLQESWSSFFWAWLPVFDETRRQESFRILVRESGLVAYWQSHGWPAMCQPSGADFRCDWQAYPPAPVPRMPIALGQLDQ